MDRKVYVITDARRRERLREALGGLARPLARVAVVAVPAWALVAVPLGLLLGWHPLLIGALALMAAPVLINLADLAGAYLGLPPMAWTARRISAAAEIPEEEENADG